MISIAGCNIFIPPRKEEEEEISPKEEERRYLHLSIRHGLQDLPAFFALPAVGATVSKNTWLGQRVRRIGTRRRTLLKKAAFGNPCRSGQLCQSKNRNPMHARKKEENIPKSTRENESSGKTLLRLIPFEVENSYSTRVQLHNWKQKWKPLHFPLAFAAQKGLFSMTTNHC